MLDDHMTYRPIPVLLHLSSAGHDLCLLGRVRGHFARRGSYADRLRFLPALLAALLGFDPGRGRIPPKDQMAVAAASAAASAAAFAAAVAISAAVLPAAAKDWLHYRVHRKSLGLCSKLGRYPRRYAQEQCIYSPKGSKTTPDQTVVMVRPTLQDQAYHHAQLVQLLSMNDH